MKTFKRIITLLLAFVLAATMALPVSAAGTGSISASAGKIKDGSVSVEVSVKDNPGFAALKLELSYDTGKLSFVGAEKGSFDTQFNTYKLSSGKINLLWDKSNGNATGDKKLCTLNFKVNSGATGTADVDLRFVEANNWDLNSLTYSAAGCTVKISDTPDVPSGGGGTGGGDVSGGDTDTGTTTETGTGTAVTRQKPYYDDVESFRWYCAAVDYVTEKNLMNGVATRLFAPGDDTSRSMVITILARMDGVDTQGSKPWYGKAVAWAQEKGISDGGNPESVITREQLVTMLYRYAQYKKLDTSKKTALTAYPDASSVHSWATEAMQWAVGTGLINGIDGNLVPRGNTSRAQLATMLMRFCQQYSL